MATRTDPYVSRGPTAHIIPRQDPVVYNSLGNEGSLTAEQLSFYKQNGYLFIPDFFSSKETQVLQTEQARLWAESTNQQSSEVIREPHDQTIRSIFAVHQNDSFFSQLAQDSRLKTMARQILGSDTYIHQSRVNFKTGFRGKEFYWHSDFETWHAEDGMPRMRALSVSIALTNNYPYNGPLMVIPGSHQHFVSCIGETPTDHYQDSLRKQQYGIPNDESLTWLVEQSQGIDMPSGNAGSLIMFDCNLMHGSSSNISPFPRSNVFLVYNSVDNRLQEPYGATAPRPLFIATR